MPKALMIGMILWGLFGACVGMAVGYHEHPGFDWSYSEVRHLMEIGAMVGATGYAAIRVTRKL